MAWLGMSIPTLPGGPKRPRSRHPGARNIERKNEKEVIPVPKEPLGELDEKPLDPLTPKPPIPEIPHQESPNQENQLATLALR